MASAPFDQTNTGLRERPLSSDQNQQVSQIYRSIRETMQQVFATRILDTSPVAQPITGFIGSGLQVTPSSPAAMTVVVNPGLGFLYDASDVPSNIGATDLEQVNDLSPYKPLPLSAATTFAVPTAPGSPNSRIDIIEVRNARRLTDSVTRRQLDPGTESFVDHVFSKTLTYALDGQTGIVTSPAASTAALSYKIGAFANPGLVPATTAGYTKIAEIYVNNGVTSIDVAKLADQRVLLVPGGIIHASVRFELHWNAGSPTIVNQETIAPPGVEILVAPVSPAAIGGVKIGVVAGSLSHGSVVVHAVDNVTSAKILSLIDPAPFLGGFGVGANALSFFSRVAAQRGGVVGVMNGVITPGSPANIDFSGGIAGLTNITVYAQFSLRA